MVLRDDDKPADTPRLARADDLVGAEVRRIQQRRVFVAIPPFAVCERVEPPVDDTDYLRPLRKPRRKLRTRNRPLVCIQSRKD